MVHMLRLWVCCCVYTSRLEAVGWGWRITAAARALGDSAVIGLRHPLPFATSDGVSFH